MSNCIFNRDPAKIEDLELTSPDWWKRNRNISLVFFFIFVFILSLIIFLINLNGFLLLVLSPVVLFISFLLSFIIYERSVQKAFFSLKKDNKKIPIYSFFNLLYDIIVKKNTLLRDMDIERMHSFGDIYVMFFGYRPAIVITSSDLAKEVSQKYNIYAKSNPIDLNMPYFYKWVGNNNIVLSNGNVWERLRGIIHKQLTATKIYFPTMCIKSVELTENIKNSLSNKKESEIFINRWLKAFSLDVAGETLFGFDFKHLKEVSNAAINAMDYIIGQIFNPLRIAFPIINKLPTRTNRELGTSIRYIDDLVNSMQKKYANDLSEENNNLLKMLINGNKDEMLSSDELRNNIITLVLSSYETTQVSLGGVLYHLAKYAEYQKLIRIESIKLFPDIDKEMVSPTNDTYEKLQRFLLLENFILESLRVYSPLANQNSRTVMEDVRLGGFHLNFGTSLIINIHAIHMNDANWNNPNNFDPHRFDKKNRPDKFSFLPFGAGARLCSGRNFSLLEQKIAVCCLLRKFEILLPNDNYVVPVKRTSFTGMPDNTFKLIFKQSTS